MKALLIAVELRRFVIHKVLHIPCALRICMYIYVYIRAVDLCFNRLISLNVLKILYLAYLDHTS